MKLKKAIKKSIKLVKTYEQEDIKRQLTPKGWAKQAKVISNLKTLSTGNPKAIGIEFAIKDKLDLLNDVKSKSKSKSKSLQSVKKNKETNILKPTEKTVERKINVSSSVKPDKKFLLLGFSVVALFIILFFKKVKLWQ